MQTLLERLQNGTIGVGAVIFVLILSYIATLFLKKQMGEEWKEFLKANYVFMFGSCDGCIRSCCIFRRDEPRPHRAEYLGPRT